MNVTVTKKGNVNIVALKGSIDSKTAPTIREDLLASLASAKDIVINMTEVDYLSSAGLRLLLLAYRDIAAKNGKVLLVGVSEEVQGVMSNTGFIKFFVLAATESEALSALA